jgi:hypothetical protein
MQEMRPHDNRLPAPLGYRNLIMTPDVDAFSKYKKKNSAGLKVKSNW